MQTILGAGGSVATHLAKELVNYTPHIRLVSRNPKKVNDTDEIVSADLLNAGQVLEAVKGSAIVYLTVGLPYNSSVWETQWLPIMENVINACKVHKAKLVFFDNVYMYGLVKGEMTEKTPFHPISKKGKARAAVASALLRAMEKKEITALIARSADFFGADTQNSVPNMMIIDKLKSGKKAQLLLSDKTVHCYTNLKDAVKAMALLGNTDSAYGQTWHLPVSESYSGKEFVEKAAALLNAKPSYTVSPKWLMNILSLFVPMIKESLEMAYQYEYDYKVSDGKFLKAFPEFKKMPFEAVIRQMAN